ncbi:MAG TPA: NAD(P)-binding protein [Acidimicrobiia bacterium]|nr:NAD(P)-binding protein [Acidimicrobiia bacterium]
MIETDYLVVGAGAAGMAFTDALIADSDADVVMIDRRHAPGGHWNDAYPFVRVHQPAAYYGVNSRRLGNDTIDETGENAGMYERATAAEICDYFQRVLDEQLRPSGQVRFFGMSDYQGDLDEPPTSSEGAEHQFVSRLTGATTTVRVRKRVVDARYLEPSIPSNHTPTFDVDPDATFIPVNGLAKLAEAPSGYTIVGGGKTSIDACLWLLDNGVDPNRIRWIRPRDSWLLDRLAYQPLQLVTNLIEALSLAAEASALADNTADLFARLEATGDLHRIDPSVEPTMFHAATVNARELELLRSIDHVVRLGHIKHIGADAISMENGEIPTDRRQVHVDCSAIGLRRSVARPVFAERRITPQAIRTVTPPFNAALAGYVEATRDDEREKTRLCPPNRYPNRAVDWMPNMRMTLQVTGMWNEEPDLAAWLERSRTNITRGFLDYAAEPRMQAAITRLITYSEPAIENLAKLEAAAVAS